MKFLFLTTLLTLFSLNLWAQNGQLGTCMTEDTMVIISEFENDYKVEIIGEDGNFLVYQYEGEEVALSSFAQGHHIQEGNYKGYFRLDHVAQLPSEKGLMPMWSLYIFKVDDGFGNSVVKAFFDEQQLYPTNQVLNCSPTLVDNFENTHPVTK